MARGSSDPKLIRSSLAILHERFMVLQLTRERRERKKLVMYFSEPNSGHLNGTFADGLVHRDQTKFSVQRQIDDHQSLATRYWKSLEGCFLPPETSSRRNQGDLGGVDFSAMPPANKRPRCSTGNPITPRALDHTDVVDTTLHL